MKRQQLNSRLTDILEALEYGYEVTNYLYSISFSELFIEACAEFPVLDDMLLEAIGHANNNTPLVKDYLNEMIDILS